MGLVGYSDSEGSDSETPNVAPLVTKPAARAPKAGFQKVIDPSAPRKIKVDLPTVKSEVKAEEERPAKKAKTAGTGGFNSFLPAPKRTAEAKKPGLGAGVSLRTGTEPAFSRERPEPTFPAEDDTQQRTPEAFTSCSTNQSNVEGEKPKEVKMVGNAMRFKPLSVANKKKKKPASMIASTAVPTKPQLTLQSVIPATAPAPPPKKKVSLFSVTQEETLPQPQDTAEVYQPILEDVLAEQSAEPQAAYEPASIQVNQNPLDAIASDLNLSASARRQLFGRNGNGAAAKIMHFDMETEYASNEVLRQQGQAQEHRAVKAIAPGKHSLQQLVNAASTQKDALEDAWAEGKRNKAEGGSRYGW